MENYAKYHNYLSNLRESGITNMWGAAPYLQKAFGIDKKTSVDALMKWMKEFDPDNPQISED